MPWGCECGIWFGICENYFFFGRSLNFIGPYSSSSFAIFDFVGCAPGRGMSAVGLTRTSSDTKSSVFSGTWTVFPGRATMFSVTISL